MTYAGSVSSLAQNRLRQYMLAFDQLAPYDRATPAALSSLAREFTLAAAHATDISHALCLIDFLSPPAAIDGCFEP